MNAAGDRAERNGDVDVGGVQLGAHLDRIEQERHRVLQREAAAEQAVEVEHDAQAGGELAGERGVGRGVEVDEAAAGDQVADVEGEILRLLDVEVGLEAQLVGGEVEAAGEAEGRAGAAGERVQVRDHRVDRPVDQAGEVGRAALVFAAGQERVEVALGRGVEVEDVADADADQVVDRLVDHRQVVVQEADRAEAVVLQVGEQREDVRLHVRVVEQDVDRDVGRVDREVSIGAGDQVRRADDDRRRAEVRDGADRGNGQRERQPGVEVAVDGDRDAGVEQLGERELAVVARAGQVQLRGEVEVRAAVLHAGGEAADVQRGDIHPGRVDRGAERERIVDLEEELVGGGKVDAEGEVALERSLQLERHAEGEAERVAVEAERGFVDRHCLRIDGVDADVEGDAIHTYGEIDRHRAVAEVAGRRRGERLLDLRLDDVGEAVDGGLVVGDITGDRGGEVGQRAGVDQVVDALVDDRDLLAEDRDAVEEITEALERRQALADEAVDGVLQRLRDQDLDMMVGDDRSERIGRRGNLALRNDHRVRIGRGRIAEVGELIGAVLPVLEQNAERRAQDVALPERIVAGAGRVSEVDPAVALLRRLRALSVAGA